MPPPPEKSTLVNKSHSTKVPIKNGMRPFRTLFLAALFAVCLVNPCSVSSAYAGRHSITEYSFGEWFTEPNPIEIYTLTNVHGLQVRILNFEGIIQSIRVPDRDGNFDDIVLGFDHIEPYFTRGPHFGSVMGRYATRIASGKPSLDGVERRLPGNAGPNILPGGANGLEKVLWRAQPSEKNDEVILSLACTSQDGQEGLSGTLNARVTYVLNDSDELIIDYSATADKPTVVNLTSHGYFNLAGQGKGDILGHELMINADRFTPVDSDMNPTGELRPVEGTPLDFRTTTPIGARIQDRYEQLVLAGGYDHYFVINRKKSEMALAARVHEPSTGRILEIYTSDPGVQFYSGNWLDGTLPGKQGRVYKKHYGFALETERFPDSPNHPSFPSTVLKTGKTYHSRTVYRFSTDK